MSGNRTYIGPFGRFLPLPEDHDEEHERVVGSVDETRSSLGMFTLPRLALDFGSDSRGFTDPLKYSSQRIAPPPTPRHAVGNASVAQVSASGHEMLPGVRQLLEPVAQPLRLPVTSMLQPSPLEPSTMSFEQSTAPETPIQVTNPSSSTNYQPSPSPAISHSMQQPTRTGHQFSDSSRLSEPITQGYAYHATPTSAPVPIYPGQAAPNIYFSHNFPQTGPSVGCPQHHHHDHEILNTFSSNQLGNFATTPILHPHTGSAKVNGVFEKKGVSNTSASPSENPVKLLQPRVVQETILPGDGPVWVYEDGSTCPKMIDGEPVNAAWGITKAGKPRKRLAIACTTCREKKIKCQPALPRCDQCEKFGRECHYSTAPRSQHIFARTISYEFQARFKPMKIKTEIQPYEMLIPLIARASKQKDECLIKRRKLLEQDFVVPNPDCPMQNKPKIQLCKKQRLSDTAVISRRDIPSTIAKKEAEETLESIEKMSWEEHPLRAQFDKHDWGTNPYNIDQRATKHYVEMFLAHGNAAAHHLFPWKAIIRWLEARLTGTRDDMMLMYAILTLGSVFSDRPNCKLDGELFAAIACRMLEHSQSHYNLQLVQSRLLLGLYYCAIGDIQSGWDFSRQGFQAALGLKLNVEEHYQNIDTDEGSNFGLKGHALVECRRRTYWLAYIMDRLVGFHAECVPMLQSEDFFLRLPCSDIVYCLQGLSTAPYLNSAREHPNPHQTHQTSAALAPMAYLVQICTIWGDVLTYIYRHSRRPVVSDALRYEEHHDEIMNRLSQWKSSLSKDLIYALSNASLAIDKGTFGLFLEIHSLYHATIIILKRNIPDNAVPRLSRNRNLLTCREQALAMLELMDIAVSASRSSRNALDTSGNFPDFPDQCRESCSPLAGSTPFAGYAVLLAVDVLSAGGATDPKSLTPLIQSMTAGLAVVNELSHCWASAIAQKEVIVHRLESIRKASTRDAASRGGRFWRCRKALDTDVSKSGQDLFYGAAGGSISSDDFFDLMGMTVDEQEVVLLD